MKLKYFEIWISLRDYGNVSDIIGSNNDEVCGEVLEKQQIK
jgi:hypothetical protein